MILRQPVPPLGSRNNSGFDLYRFNFGVNNPKPLQTLGSFEVSNTYFLFRYVIRQPSIRILLYCQQAGLMSFVDAGEE